MEFFQNLEPLLRTFWFIAIPVSLVFLIQTAMTFLGADAGDGTQADFDSNLDGVDAPFQLFSLRNLINFLLGFSWSGISFYQHISSKLLLVIIATLVGAAFVILFFVIIKQLLKLAEDNSFNIQSTLGKTAEVYIPIPKQKEGKGKIQISINGSVHELDAMTEQELLASNTMVKVVKILNDNLLLVEKI